MTAVEIEDAKVVVHIHWLADTVDHLFARTAAAAAAVVVVVGHIGSVDMHQKRRSFAVAVAPARLGQVADHTYPH